MIAVPNIATLTIMFRAVMTFLPLVIFEIVFFVVGVIAVITLSDMANSSIWMLPCSVPCLEPSVARTAFVSLSMMTFLVLMFIKMSSIVINHITVVAFPIMANIIHVLLRRMPIVEPSVTPTATGHYVMEIAKDAGPGL